MNSISGAVLAGGSSRRMGADKSLIEIDGVALVRRVADALAGAGCHPIHVQGGDAESIASLGLSVVPDRWPGEGPLSGVISALLHLGSDVVIAACDLPDLDAHTVRAVAFHVRTAATARPGDAVEVDAVVATTDRRQPVLARWNVAALPLLLRSFEAGERSLLAMLDRLVVTEVAVEERRLLNANTPDDLAGRS